MRKNLRHLCLQLFIVTLAVAITSNSVHAEDSPPNPGTGVEMPPPPAPPKKTTINLDDTELLKEIDRRMAALEKRTRPDPVKKLALTPKPESEIDRLLREARARDAANQKRLRERKEDEDKKMLREIKARLVEAKKTLTKPPVNVRVEITRLEVEKNDHRTLGMLLNYRDRKTNLRAGQLGGRNGLRLFAAKHNIFAALQAGGERRQQRSVQKQFIMTMVGYPARMSLIQRARRAWSVQFPVYRGTAVVTTIDEEVTGSGMRVLVRSATPTAIDVELTPYFNRKKRAGGRLEITELATRVILAPGRPYVIMSDRQSNKHFATAFLTQHSGTTTREIVHILTVDRAAPAVSPTPAQWK